MCWKRWYCYHCGRSVLQYPDTALRAEVVYGRVCSDSRRDDKVCRSQPQGGVHLQEGPPLSLQRSLCDGPQCSPTLRRGPRPQICLRPPHLLLPKRSTSYTAPPLARRCYKYHVVQTPMRHIRARAQTRGRQRLYSQMQVTRLRNSYFCSSSIVSVYCSPK